MIEDFLWWVGEKVDWVMFVCMYVCMDACSSIWAPGARTEGLFGTGEYLFDALERRIDNVLVTDESVARGTCHVRSRKPLQKNLMSIVQAKPMHEHDRNFMSQWLP